MIECPTRQRLPRTPTNGGTSSVECTLGSSAEGLDGIKNGAAAADDELVDEDLELPKAGHPSRLIAQRSTISKG